MRGVPHAPQNFCPLGFSCWHRGQGIWSGSPVRIVSGQRGTASRHPGRRQSSASRPFHGARRPDPTATRPRAPDGASDQNFGYRTEGAPSKVTVTNSTPGGDRDASQSAGVRRRAAGALPARAAGGEAPAAERGGGGHRAASQGGHPPAAAPAAPAPRVAPARAARAATAPPWPPRPSCSRRPPATSAPTAGTPSSPSCSIA